MYTEITAFFLGLSVLFYCLFAGADFGGGILELFLGSEKRLEQKELIRNAISPVWEANHVWIILAVVILFNGFPEAFGQISTILHVPILVMLLGIILRGCAFTFDHYDAVRDHSQKYYSAIFVIASVLTPLTLGIIAGALFLGRAPVILGDFAATYIFPWFNLFCFSIGIFLCAIFSFLAAVYLVGETNDPKLKEIFSKKARVANIVTVVLGGCVFLSAEIDGFHLLNFFLKHKVTIIFVGLATLSLLPLWIALKKEFIWTPRFLATGQVTLILLGWFLLQFPNILVRTENSLDIYNTSAPIITLQYLLDALIIGIVLIFPALAYLFLVFKRRPSLNK